MLALAIPVQFYVGWQYYVGAYKALRNKSANMDVLIAMGSSVAYFYSVAITLGANMPKRMDTGTLLAPEPLAALSAGALAMALLIWASYSGAERMSRAIGPTGMSVVMRLSSFILLCIGVQITWNGLAAMSGWHR